MSTATQFKESKTTQQQNKASSTTLNERKKLKINPVEAVIFLAVTGFFSSSVYNLVNDTDAIKAAALENTKATRTLSSTRSNDSNSAQELLIDCSLTQSPFLTGNSIVKIRGQLCLTDKEATSVLIQSHDKSIQFEAFVNPDGNEYTTPPVALKTGDNPFKLEQKGKSKKTWTKELMIRRE
jgi:hypothetical protein